jgi:cytochrome c-type biogenesis protein CcmE
MSVKKPKFDMRTILYILIAVLIVVSVVYLVLNSSNDSEEVLSVNNVLLNKELYLGEEIKVRGIYDSQTADQNYLKPSYTTNLDPAIDMLMLNLSQIDINIRENLTEDNQYIVTGILSEIEAEDGFNLLNVELVASKIEEV